MIWLGRGDGIGIGVRWGGFIGREAGQERGMRSRVGLGWENGDEGDAEGMNARLD